MLTVPPRAHYMSHLLHPDDRQPPIYDASLTTNLPRDLLTHIGAVRQGYRSQELWAEHTVMRQLEGSAVPVPRSLAFVEQGALSNHCRGEPLL